MYSYDHRAAASKDLVKLEFVRYSPRTYSIVHDALEWGEAFDFGIKIGVTLKGKPLDELMPGQDLEGVTEQQVLAALKGDRKVLAALMPELVYNVAATQRIEPRRLSFAYPTTMKGRVKKTTTAKTKKTTIRLSHLVLTVKVAKA